MPPAIAVYRCAQGLRRLWAVYANKRGVGVPELLLRHTPGWHQARVAGSQVASSTEPAFAGRERVVLHICTPRFKFPTKTGHQQGCIQGRTSRLPPHLLLDGSWNPGAQCWWRGHIEAGSCPPCPPSYLCVEEGAALIDAVRVLAASRVIVQEGCCKQYQQQAQARRDLFAYLNAACTHPT